MFEICKVRKTCIICKNYIFKGEQYFRTYDKGKATCWKCLEEAQNSINKKEPWLEKSEDYKIIYNEDDILNCNICSSHKKKNIILSINYAYSVRSFRGWVTRWTNAYICEQCLSNFLSSLTEEEKAMSDMNRLERAVANLS